MWRSVSVAVIVTLTSFFGLNFDPSGSKIDEQSQPTLEGLTLSSRWNKFMIGVWNALPGATIKESQVETLEPSASAMIVDKQQGDTMKNLQVDTSKSSTPAMDKQQGEVETKTEGDQSFIHRLLESLYPQEALAPEAFAPEASIKKNQIGGVAVPEATPEDDWLDGWQVLFEKSWTPSSWKLPSFQEEEEQPSEKNETTQIKEDPVEDSVAVLSASSDDLVSTIAANLASAHEWLVVQALAFVNRVYENLLLYFLLSVLTPICAASITLTEMKERKRAHRRRINTLGGIFEDYFQEESRKNLESFYGNLGGKKPNLVDGTNTAVKAVIVEREEKRGNPSKDKLLEISATITTTTTTPESETMSSGLAMEEVERKEEEREGVVDMDEEAADREAEEATTEKMVTAAEQEATGEKEEEEVTVAKQQVIGEQDDENVTEVEQEATGKREEENVTVVEQEATGKREEESVTEAEGTTFNDEKMAGLSTRPKEEYPSPDVTNNELAVVGNKADIAELLKMPKRENIAAVGPMGDAMECRFPESVVQFAIATSETCRKGGVETLV